MKHKFYKSLAMLAAAAAWTACAHSHGDDELAHHHDHEHGEAHEAGAEIHLEPEAAERFGVASDTIVPGDFTEVIKVTGMVVENPGSASVVSAPTAGVVTYAPGMQPGKSVAAGTTVATVSAAGISGGDRNNADRVALEAARKEVERLEPLYADGIVSAKDYNAAVAALEAAKAQYSPKAASGAAKAVGAGVITEMLVPNGMYVEAGTPIATVSANRRLTLRADVPDRYASSLPLVSGARVRLPHSEAVVDLADLNGSRISQAEGHVRLSPGYLPVYFSFDNNGSMAANTLVDVYLTARPRAGVVSVPVEAVVEQQGSRFVFRQIDEDCYEKLPVTLGQSDGIRVEVLSGLEGGEYIVVKGATAVRLAESSAVVPEGHSHSH